MGEFSVKQANLKSLIKKVKDERKIEKTEGYIRVFFEENEYCPVCQYESTLNAGGGEYYNACDDEGIHLLLVDAKKYDHFYFELNDYGTLILVKFHDEICNCCWGEEEVLVDDLQLSIDNLLKEKIYSHGVCAYTGMKSVSSGIFNIKNVLNNFGNQSTLEKYQETHWDHKEIIMIPKRIIGIWIKESISKEEKEEMIQFASSFGIKVFIMKKRNSNEVL
jgi:hypothetical protein